MNQILGIWWILQRTQCDLAKNILNILEFDELWQRIDFFFLILLLKLLANQPTPSPCPKFKPISMAHIHSWFYLKIFQIRSQLLSRRHTTTQVRHHRTSQLPPQHQSATTTEERFFVAAFTTKIGF